LNIPTEIQHPRSKKEQVKKKDKKERQKRRFTAEKMKKD
jgi:hypothetical protein